MQLTRTSRDSSVLENVEGSLTLHVIACIEDPDVIATILGHIRARDKAKPAQLRAPPLRAGHPDPTT